MSQLTVTLPEAEEKRLRAHSERLGIPEEEMVLRLIRALPVDDQSESTDTEPDLLDELQELMSRVPPEELARVPRDLSENLDHYLYGAPRK